MTVIAILYFLVAGFYLIFGVLNFYQGLVTSSIPAYFPLLADFGKPPLAQSLILIYISLTLVGVGYLLLLKSKTALVCAAILSLWEIFLGYFFYWDLKHDMIQTIAHLVIHGTLFIVIIRLYRDQVRTILVKCTGSDGVTFRYFKSLKEELMSEISDKLNKVNADIRAAILAEREQVKIKLDELSDKIDELEGSVGNDTDTVAAIEDTKKIVEEIQAIYEPSTPPVEPPVEPTA